MEQKARLISNHVLHFAKIVGQPEHHCLAFVVNESFEREDRKPGFKIQTFKRGEENPEKSILKQVYWNI